MSGSTDSGLRSATRLSKVVRLLLDCRQIVGQLPGLAFQFFIEAKPRGPSWACQAKNPSKARQAQVTTLSNLDMRIGQQISGESLKVW